MSDNKEKKVGKNVKCASVVCCISKYDLNIEWVKCSNCHRWVHILCNGNSQGTSQFAGIIQAVLLMFVF